MRPAAKLLQWYDRHGRDLPWRKTRDPYRILVSEIMLQQTQVDRVVSFYGRWLKQFPTWKTLSVASNSDVIFAWAGLGYNRRALVLRDIAREVVARGVPQTESDWLSLKGIGPYTAAAISAFAQHRRTLPIDTNIRRVLGRLLLGKTFPTIKNDDRIRHAAEAFLPQHARHYDIPQAIFDLATSICTKIPSCASCPLRHDCKAAKLFLRGNVKIPKRTVSVAHEHHHRNKPHPDRIYRGRILKLLREWGQPRRQAQPGSGPRPPHSGASGVLIQNVGSLVDPDFNRKLDQKWINKMIDRLERDGLLQKIGNKLSLIN